MMGPFACPRVLHLPNLGTFRITATPARVWRWVTMLCGTKTRKFAGQRFRESDDLRRHGGQSAAWRTRWMWWISIPGLPQIANDPRFDGFRRDWLNIFQLAPRFRALANHAASDVVPFTLFEYSAMAVRTPPLAPGLTALDLIRATLDRYLSGMKGYGQAGYIPNDATHPTISPTPIPRC